MTAAVVGARAATASKASTATKAAPSSKGYTDAVVAGGEKAKPKADKGSALSDVGNPLASVSKGAKGLLSTTAKTGAQRALVAEFALCVIVLALHPIAKGDGEVKAGDWMKKGSALCGVFLLLGLLSSAGPRMAKASVAFGGLITLVLVVDQRSVFAKLTERLKGEKNTLNQDGGGDDATDFITQGNGFIGPQVPQGYTTGASGGSTPNATVADGGWRQIDATRLSSYVNRPGGTRYL